MLGFIDVMTLPYLGGKSEANHKDLPLDFPQLESIQSLLLIMKALLGGSRPSP
jgi:hypothetical protein